MAGKKYTIPFSGLKEGDYEYDFVLDNAFFENFPESGIQKADINVLVKMVRREHMLVLDITFNGNVMLECDRCGNEYAQQVKGSRKMVVNLNAEEFDDEDDLISLPASYHDLNLEQYLYEYVILELPNRRVCPEVPGCDPDVISKLNELKAGEDEEIDEGQSDEPSDPRWDALKNIRFKN